jgi:hypothetical protein
MDPIDPSQSNDPLTLVKPQQREVVKEDVRRFGDFDEITETLESLQMVDGKVEQVDVRQLVFKIKRDPEVAEAVQANLDPERIRNFIVD